jgi:hypothetical protein
MKRVVLVLILLLAVESWGVYGAAKARHVYVTCTMEVGPLCFVWEDNALGKLIGKERQRDVDEALVKARKVWEHDFVERMIESKKSGSSIQKALDDAAEKAKQGLQELGDKLKDATK